MTKSLIIWGECNNELKMLFGYHDIKVEEKQEFCKCVDCIKKKLKYLTNLEIKESCKRCGKVFHDFYKTTPTGY